MEALLGPRRGKHGEWGALPGAWGNTECSPTRADDDCIGNPITGTHMLSLTLPMHVLGLPAPHSELILGTGSRLAKLQTQLVS
jgi:hypothetical protein